MKFHPVNQSNLWELEIIPSEAQPEEELIISAPNQPEDNAQPEDNPLNDENDQQEQNLRPVHPRVANEVQTEKIIDSINAPGPLTRSRATQLANFCGHFAFVSISEPKKVKPSWNLNAFKLCKNNFNSLS